MERGGGVVVKAVFSTTMRATTTCGKEGGIIDLLSIMESLFVLMYIEPAEELQEKRRRREGEDSSIFSNRSCIQIGYVKLLLPSCIYRRGGRYILYHNPSWNEDRRQHSLYTSSYILLFRVVTTTTTREKKVVVLK